MKYILTENTGNVLGPFNTVTETDEGYIADGALYSTFMFGTLIKSEVSDDYINPNIIIDYNNKQTQLRAAAYPIQSDPIFFQWQRGSKTEQDWLDAVAGVKEQYPYKEQV